MIQTLCLRCSEILIAARKTEREAEEVLERIKARELTFLRVAVVILSLAVGVIAVYR